MVYVWLCCHWLLTLAVVVVTWIIYFLFNLNHPFDTLHAIIVFISLFFHKSRAKKNTRTNNNTLELQQLSCLMFTLNTNDEKIYFQKHTEIRLQISLFFALIYIVFGCFFFSWEGVEVLQRCLFFYSRWDGVIMLHFFQI